MTFKDNIHSYDPGSSLNGVVWTTRVLPDSVDIDLRNGTGRFSVEDLKVSDWFSLSNGFRQGKHVPATVSFDVRWDTPLEQVRIRDPQVGFRAEHVENQATIEWSAEQEGFQFISDPAETSTSTDSKVGRERNGVFFR